GSHHEQSKGTNLCQKSFSSITREHHLIPSTLDGHVGYSQQGKRQCYAATLSPSFSRNVLNSQRSRRSGSSLIPAARQPESPLSTTRAARWCLRQTSATEENRSRKH